METSFFGVFQVKGLAEVIKDKNAFPVSTHEREPCPTQGTATCGSPSSGRTNCSGWLEGTEKMQTDFRER